MYRGTAMQIPAKTASALVGLAVLAALGGCQKAAPKTETATAAASAWSLDESKLPQPIGFLATDIDPAQSACVDLDATANGKWYAANPIPSDQTRWGAFEVLRERSLGVQRQLAERAAADPAAVGISKIVADLWVTGMDEVKLNASGIEPLKGRLAEIDALTDGPSVAAYLRTVAARGENELFGFGPEADFKESSMNIAYAEQGGLGLPDKTYYFDADKKPVREAYEKHIAKVLLLAGVPDADATAQAAAVMKFETRLARVSKSSEDLSRDVSIYYNPVSVADADKLTPNFSWTAFFNAQGIAKPEKFSLAIPGFHREVSRMLGDVPVKDWQGYLRFHLVDGASPLLTEAFATENFEFYRKTLSGQKEQRPRWKRVLAVVESAAGEAMGQLYVDAAFPPDSKVRMEQLVTNLRGALKTHIENLGWMSDTTKQKALEKWGAFTTKIGYTDKWRDLSGLVTKRDSFFENVMAAQAFNYQWELGKIGKPVDKTEWNMTPQTVNAYYNPLANEIVFPAAILQPPFFDPAADDALNYGAIGAVIGHELTHGYDDQGARFGANGNFEQWWTAADAAKFKAVTTQLVKQYDQYEALPGLKVNGNLTLGENIADLGGLSVAYDALQTAALGKADATIDGLTRDQRFFYGFATAWRSQATPERQKVMAVSDPHSPSRARANGTPTNVPAFAAAFGCKDTDPMVNAGDKRVVIW
jgi:putative endopeptidase